MQSSIQKVKKQTIKVNFESGKKNFSYCGDKIILFNRYFVRVGVKCLSTIFNNFLKAVDVI